MSKNITDADFDNAVATGLSLVDFWAPWCGPCRMIAPILDELSTELAGSVQILKMNVDENQNTPARFGVRSIPALMLFKNGQLLDTKVGVLQKPALKSWIEGHAG